MMRAGTADISPDNKPYPSHNNAELDGKRVQISE